MAPRQYNLVLMIYIAASHWNAATKTAAVASATSFGGRNLHTSSSTPFIKPLWVFDFLNVALIYCDIVSGSLQHNSTTTNEVKWRH